MHGKGTFTYPKGEVYEGEFVQGALEGTGKLTLLNLSYYQGEWLKSFKHGKGEEKTKDGELKRRGIWDHGEF